MHESAPIPPDPESQRRGHELRDVALRPVLYFLIGLFVFGGLLQTVLSTVMRGVVAQDTRVGVPTVKIEAARTAQRSMLTKGLRDTNNVGDNVRPAPAPHLQRDTTTDMLRMYAEEDVVLNTYHVDDKSKQVRIPIDRAMAIMVKKGLPHRDATVEKVDNDPLPYPARSLPYMATP